MRLDSTRDLFLGLWLGAPNLADGWLGESKFQRDFKVGTRELAPEGDVSALVACITRFLQGW